MTGPAGESGKALSFGPFTLTANERLLKRNGVSVELGARALDILIVLTARPGEIVGKRDLLAGVWPDAVVDEGSLRFHVANLRKALGDGRNGARYIATLAGRGYCFVAPVSRPDNRNDADAEAADDAFAQADLPNRLTRMVGRADDLSALSARLSATRFVTIVGTGGVGKTTVAVAVGHELSTAFAGAVHFVDLGALSDPSLVTATVASMLGLSVRSADAAPSLIAHLKNRRTLLILDTCEHLVEAVADLSSRIFAAAPQAYILATSREALRIEGEQIHKLAPLACPPDDLSVTASQVETFPAMQLFMERAAASGAKLDLDDDVAAAVAGICRRLDGVPLAIELAAGRVDDYGLRETAALLDRRFALLWPGQRSAPPRQKTLQATLDWSYGLLSGLERRVLRRLAVFVGSFTIEAALDVVSDGDIEEALVFGAIDGLVAKSMVAARPVGAMMRYRLLDTTRAHALQTETEAGLLAKLSARHASFHLRWLASGATEWPTLTGASQRALHLAGLANVRAALEWAFGAEDGDARLGVRLAAAAAPVFLAMSLLTECHRWTERAILALDDATRDGREEMHLQAALGVSLMFTRGGREVARVALDRSFAIAEKRGDPLEQLQVLAPLQMFHLRTGEFRTALRHSERCSVVSRRAEDAVAVGLAHSLMGISLHLAGDLDRARTELESALRIAPPSGGSAANYLGFDGRILAGAILARTLWLQGWPDQAAERARLTVADADAMQHPLTLSIALVWAISVFLWTGDLPSADQHLDRLFRCAEPHGLEPYLAVGRGFSGELAIRRGDVNAGIEELQASLSDLHAAPYELLSTPLSIALAQGFVAAGRLAEAHNLIDDAMRSVEANGDLCYLPELLRLKGNVALAASQPDDDEPETWFDRSLELSRRQGVRAWELRAATDLASLFAARRQPERALAILQPIVARFEEGIDTADLMAATHLLGTLK